MADLLAFLEDVEGAGRSVPVLQVGGGQNFHRLPASCACTGIGLLFCGLRNMPAPSAPTREMAKDTTASQSKVWPCAMALQTGGGGGGGASTTVRAEARAIRAMLLKMTD